MLPVTFAPAKLPWGSGQLHLYLLGAGSLPQGSVYHTEYFQYDKEGRQVVQVDRKGNRTQTRFNVYGKPVYQACTDRKESAR